MNYRQAKTFVTLALTACALNAAGRAYGQTSQFIGPVGGSWFDPANWSTGTVPDVRTDAVTETLITIDQPGAVAATLQGIGDGGVDLLDAAGASFTTGGQSLLSMESVCVSRQFGGINQTGALWIGISAQGQYVQYGGTLLADSIFVGNGQNAWASGGDGLYERFGGDLIGGDLRIGYYSDSSGTFRQYAGTTTLAGTVLVGLENGGNWSDRRLEILGGSFSCAGALIGAYEFGRGTVIVGNAHWHIDGDLTLADCLASGSLEVRNGGLVTAQSALFAGPDAGATVTVDGEASRLEISNHLSTGVGPGAGATINVLNGGQLSSESASLGFLSSYLPGKARITIDGQTSKWTISKAPIELRGGSGLSESRLTLSDGGVLAVSDLKLVTSSLYGSGGTVQGNLVNLGRCMPGATTPSEPSFGTLDIEGMYSQHGTYVHQNQTVASSGKLLIELGGYVAGAEHDALDIGGEFQGGGELVLALANGFDPPKGAAFNIVTCSSLLEPFATVTMPVFADEREFAIAYVDAADGPDLIRVRVTTSCPADIDSSAHIDVADLMALVTEWGQCPTGVCSSDVSGNGVVDVSDLLMLVSAWGACP